MHNRTMVQRFPGIFVSVAVGTFAFGLLSAFSSLQAESADISKLPEAENFWKRYPVLTIPYISTPPKIDGVVDRAEWKTAAQLGPLKSDREGVADELEREVFLARDDENLYIAWILERPDGARVPQMPEQTGRVPGIRGDIVEINIDPGRTEQSNYHFLIHANGAFVDATGRPNADTSWNADWERAATLTNTGWQGEASIPFVELGLDGPPEEGSVWGFDFIDNQRTPVRGQSHWSHRGAHWHKFSNYGYLIFEGKPPSVRFVRAREAGDGRLIAEFDIVNPGEQPVEVNASLALFQRKEGTSGGVSSFFDHIESGGDDDYESGEVEFYKGATLQGLVEDAYRFYDPIEEGVLRENVQVDPDQTRRIGLVLPGDPGEYLLEYAFRKDEAPIHLGTSVFQILTPLDLRVQPYWLYSQQLHIQADLRKLEAPDGGTLKLTLSPAEGGEKIAEATHSVGKEDDFVETWLPVKGITPGFYKITAVLTGPDGEEIGTNTHSLERPQNPAWFANDHGNKIKVPPPWTPLTATPDGVVEVWNRRYDLSTFFPRSFQSAEAEILAEPVDFHLVIDGRKQEWKTKSLELEATDEAMARYRAELEGADATIQGVLEIEFDGFAWYELEVTPREASMNVDELYVEISMVPERAVLCTGHRGGIGGHQIGGMVTETTGTFTCYQWMGDEEGGFAFIAEGPINWRLKNPEEPLEMTPGSNGTPARLRVNIIDHKVTLDSPLELAFGFQGTPIRKMPPDTVTHVWQTNAPLNDEDYYIRLQEQGAKVVGYHDGWKSPGPLKPQEWSGWPTRPRIEERSNDLREAVKLAQKYGMKVLLYTGWGIDTGSDEWREFGPEFVRMPIENSAFNTYRQSAGLKGAYADYMAWAWADLIDEYGMDGVLWDSTANFLGDENLGIGNGWVDEEGNVHPTFPVRATRELFRRVYTLFNGENTEGGVILNHPGSIWAINAFSDIHHRGEGNPMHVKKLRDAWNPLEVYRASYWGKPFGLASLGMNKNSRQLPMRMNHHHAVTWLHGGICKSAGAAQVMNENVVNRNYSYEYDRMPLPAMWQARNWLPFDGEEERFYYYEPGEPVALEPDSLLSSVFRSQDGKRAIVVVSNLDDQELSGAQVRLDLEKIGLNSGGGLLAEDAITSEEITIENGAFSVDILPERFRLIKVWSE